MLSFDCAVQLDESAGVSDYALIMTWAHNLYKILPGPRKRKMLKSDAPSNLERNRIERISSLWSEITPNDSLDVASGKRLWSNVMDVLGEQDGIDTELLVFAMSLINKTLSNVPDQDTFYDVTDALEEQNIFRISQVTRSGRSLCVCVFHFGCIHNLLSLGCGGVASNHCS